MEEKSEIQLTSYCLRMPEKIKTEIAYLSKVYKRSLNKQILLLIESFISSNREILEDLDNDLFNY